MRKIITAGLSALTLAGALAAGPAMAQRHWDRDRGRDRHYGYRHDNTGAAVAAGIAGLAVGAALANGNDGYYSGGYYYGRPDYAYRYYYGPRYGGPRRCTTRMAWSYRWGRYVERTRCW